MHTARQKKERGIVRSCWPGQVLEKSCYMKEGIANDSVIGEKYKPRSTMYHIKMQIPGRNFKNKNLTKTEPGGRFRGENRVSRKWPYMTDIRAPKRTWNSESLLARCGAQRIPSVHGLWSMSVGRRAHSSRQFDCVLRSDLLKGRGPFWYFELMHLLKNLLGRRYTYIPTISSEQSLLNCLKKGYSGYCPNVTGGGLPWVHLATE